MNSIAFFYAASLKATIILSAGGLLAFLMRRQSAVARYFLWTATLVAAMALPLLTIALERTNLRLQTPVAATLVPMDIVEPVAIAPALAAPAKTFPVALSLGLLWTCGLIATLSRLALGHRRARSLVRHARPLHDPDWTALLATCTARLGVNRKVELRRATEIDVPLSYGFFRPTILLPEDSESWDDGRRLTVLTHELIHVRRADPVWSLLCQCAAAVYWFHPLAWIALTNFRREQERSCDDAVVRAGIGQSVYAGHLVGVARSAGDWAAAQGMASPWDLEERVRAILDPHRRRHALSRRTLIAALTAIAVCVIPLAALHAQSANTASLTGSIYDASGAAIPRASILLKAADGTGEEIAQANPAGEYQFHRIKSGHYNIEVKAPGFARLEKSGVTLAAGASEKLDLTLALGNVAESLDVVGKRTQPAPPSTATPHRIRVGGNVQATKLVKRIVPTYPPNAMAAGISGTVLMRAVISTGGDLLGLSVINTSDSDLATAAMDAVKQWKYQPTLLNGQPVEVITTIAVNFKLES